MGIILKKLTSLKNSENESEKKKEEFIFYLKGADIVMKQFVTNRQKRGFIEEECKDLSMTGLRTLVITKKVLTKDFFQSWSKRYEGEYNKLEINHAEIDKLMFEL